MQLYLNNQLADMSDDAPVALTFQINNLAEVKNQQGNTSNQFKIPLTQHNRQILGFPDDVAFTTNLPYTRYEARIIQDGMEIVPQGFAELNSVDDNTASITVLSGNVDFFDAIDGKLYDMGDKTTPWGKNLPWQPYDHLYNIGNVAASQTKTDGWIWPIVNYGSVVYDEKATNTDIDIRNLRPGFFLKTAIDLMVQNAGFKATGSLLADPLYNNLVVQFANDNFEHGTDYVNNFSGLKVAAVCMQPHGYTYGSNGADESFRFIKTSVGNDANYDGSVSAFLATSNMDVNVNVSFALDYASAVTDGSVKITLERFDPASNAFDVIKSVEYRSDNVPDSNRRRAWDRFRMTFEKQVFNCSLSISTGQSLRVFYHIPQDVKQYMTIRMLPGSTFTITQKTEEHIATGQVVQCERIFPDISQKDLLKDTLQRFGIICQTDSITRTVNFASFRDVIANLPRAADWTDKCLNQGKSINFRLGNYAQLNDLKYKEDDGIIPVNFGNSQIKIDDANLPATGTLFESQFAATLGSPFAGGSMALIRKIDHESGDTDFSISTQPRIFVNQAVNLNQYGKTITLHDDRGNSTVLNGTVSVPYFYKPDGEYNLCWGDMPANNGTGTIAGLQKTYYAELEKILKQAKKVVRWFMLTPRDILELDLLIPVYLRQDGAYYYINKIDSWRKGQPVKVELVKLG